VADRIRGIEKQLENRELVSGMVIRGKENIENYLKEKPHRHPHADSSRNRKKYNLALPDPQVRETIVRQYQEEQKRLEEILRMVEQAEKRVSALEQAIAVYTPETPKTGEELEETE
jgi:hypothetical protein